MPLPECTASGPATILALSPFSAVPDILHGGHHSRAASSNSASSISSLANSLPTHAAAAAAAAAARAGGGAVSLHPHHRTVSMEERWVRQSVGC